MYVENTVHIDAPQDVVVNVFYNFSSWTELIRELEPASPQSPTEPTPVPRRPTAGTKLRVDLDRWMISTRTPKVKTATEEGFSWVEKKGHPLVFEARHRFGFTKEDESGNECDTKTKFSHRVQLKGALAWVYFTFSKRKLKATYMNLVEKLVAEVTAQQQAGSPDKSESGNDLVGAPHHDPARQA